MLDTRADFRFRIVGPPHRLVHRAAFRLLAMDVADEAILGQECLVGCRSVGGIGPHPARRIALVEQALAQTTALIGSRICGRPSADEAETPIDRDMRASRSLCRSLAGLAFQFVGIRPCCNTDDEKKAIKGGIEPSSRGLALLNLTVQRAIGVSPLSTTLKNSRLKWLQRKAIVILSAGSFL